MPRKGMISPSIEASLGSVVTTPPLNTLASQVSSRLQLQFQGHL